MKIKREHVIKAVKKTMGMYCITAGDVDIYDKETCVIIGWQRKDNRHLIVVAFEDQEVADLWGRFFGNLRKIANA